MAEVIRSDSDEVLEGLRLRVEELLGAKIREIRVFRGEITCVVAASDIVSILVALRDESGGGFTQLSDLTASDYPKRKDRFEIIYQLLSVGLNQRLRLCVSARDGEVIPSVSHLFSSAIWAEREVWDMFGIFFSGHDDLRRLLTDYGFEGHPLRKDFPLTGTVETRYDAELGRVVYEPVRLEQEYRDFDFMSPWEGAEAAFRQESETNKSGDGE